MIPRNLFKHILFPLAGVVYGTWRGVTRVAEMSQQQELTGGFMAGFVTGNALVWGLIGAVVTMILLYAERSSARRRAAAEAKS